MGKVGKLCDYCKTSAAVLYCRMEKVFMCMICNAGSSEVHARHERVGMCEVCEQAPASVTCKADAAALCVTCDRNIHSANPLARRHQRVAVVPLCVTASFQSKSASAFLVPNSDASNSVGESPQSNLVDFDYPGPVTTCHQFHNLADSAATDSVVPVQLVKQITPASIIIENLPEIPFEIDFTASDFNSFNYPAQSISQSVSSSSIDVGVVPDWNAMTDISYPFSLQLNNSTEIVSSANQSQNQPTPLSRIEREARVMRYREKRKNRKFEKTIRYASRKAYAEARPRIKGRFAKRTDTKNSIDYWFVSNSATYFTDSEHGVVPSF